MAFDEEKAKKQFNIGCLAFVGVFAIILFVLVSLGSDSDDSTGSTVSSGDDGVTSTDTYLALSESSFDEMMDYFNAENIDALGRMEAKGTLVFVPKGTQVTVVDRGIFKTKVEVISTGQRGFIISEFIKK